jgi:hypothetical protein
MIIPSGAGSSQFLNTGEYTAGLVQGYWDLFDSGKDRIKLGGIENIIEYNGFQINVPGRQDKIFVNSIEGLADADVRDTREANPGYDGETAFESHYGGRTIVISGVIKAGTLSKLRDMQEGLKSIFAPLNEAALILKGISPDYDVQIFCRKSQPITMGETQKNFLFERDFQVTLRASDFRFTAKMIQEEYWDWWNIDDQESNSYSALVLSDRPELYWRMNEASGATTFINSVASGTYAGTKVGTPSGVNASGAVLEGAYWDFNGTTDYITSSYTPYASGTSRTFEAWVNRDTSNTEDVIFGSSDATNSPRLAFPSGTETMVFKPNGATGSGVTFTASGIGSTESWKHIALVFEDSVNTANLYLNGAQVASGTTADQFHATPGNFQVGRSATSPDSYFDGKIAEVAVYGSALSATKISNHYKSRTKYFSGNVYAKKIINSGNYLADAIIKIQGPVYAINNGETGIEISNTENLNSDLVSGSSTSDILSQEINAISSGNATTALNIDYNNNLKIKAPSGTTTVITENEYLLINTNTRTINKYSEGNIISSYSQLDFDSEWIKFSPGINKIFVNCYGYSRPLITFYYRHTFI